MIRFCRDPADLGVEVLDISIVGPQPYCRLSLDYQHGQIPIPTMAGQYADTVTGMMEGLRLIGPVGEPAHINPGYFVGPARPRPLKPKQWQTGWYVGRPVNLPSARRQVLVPAYRWVLEHRLGDLVAQIRSLARVRTVGLYDGIGSADINSPDRLSTAALLAAYLNGTVQEFTRGIAMFEN